MIKSHLTKLMRFKKFILKKIKNFTPETAVILGSGLSGSLPEMTDVIRLPYKSIPGFFKTTVSGHKGEFIFGRYAGKNIAVMNGRFHYYEGYGLDDIVLVVRLLHGLGVKNIIISSAVGSLHKKMKPGDMVILKDHINFFCDSTLRGIYHNKFGSMFVDLNDAYDRKLRNIAFDTAKILKIPVHKGVYIGVAGPNFETPAEIKAFKLFGADVVGMSIIPEVIAARQLGIKILGCSWVSNFAGGVEGLGLSHNDVLLSGEDASVKFKKILERILKFV